MNFIQILFSLFYFFFQFSKTACESDVPKNKKLNSSRVKDCVEHVNNFIIGNSEPEDQHELTVTTLEGAIYSDDGSPSCQLGRPLVPMPGILKILRGELIVPRKYNLLKSAVLKLSIRSPNFTEPLCVGGKSGYAVLPNSFCNLDLCGFIGKDMCEILETPGIHTIKELEEKIKFNTTLILPDPPSFLGISLLDLFSGDFSFGFVVETEDRAILSLKIPTNHDYLRIGC